MLLGGLRVFLLSAAFPFFNNVDEHAQFDAIYGRAEHLRTTHIRRFTPEAAKMIATFSSLEFLDPPETGGPAYPSPLWKTADGGNSPQAISFYRYLVQAPNHESTGSPLYYNLEVAWRFAGIDLGLSGLQLIYWLRFLNVPLYVTGMVIAWWFCLAFCPRTPVWRWGPLIMLAAWPQDVFYSLNNDVLSFPLGTAFLWLLARWLRRDNAAEGHSGKPKLALAAGLALGLALLTKLSNLPLLLIGLAGGVIQLRTDREPGTRRYAISTLFAVAALVPPGIWALHNLLASGDPTANSEKIRLLGWTRKPVGQWLHNPIFSFQGLWTFWSELMRTWWRGELFWHGSVLTSAPVDTFYVWSSTLFLMAALTCLTKNWLSRRGLAGFDRVVALCLAIFLGYVGYLAVLGLPYDFGSCIFPSRAFPYFTTGRLMTAAMVPFAVVYLRGYSILTGRLSERAQLAIFCALMLGITGGDLAISQSVFASQYNWFHLQKPVDPALAQLR